MKKSVIEEQMDKMLSKIKEGCYNYLKEAEEAGYKDFYTFQDLYYISSTTMKTLFAGTTQISMENALKLGDFSDEFYAHAVGMIRNFHVFNQCHIDCAQGKISPKELSEACKGVDDMFDGYIEHLRTIHPEEANWFESIIYTIANGLAADRKKFIKDNIKDINEVYKNNMMHQDLFS